MTVPSNDAKSLTKRSKKAANSLPDTVVSGDYKVTVSASNVMLGIALRNSTMDRLLAIIPQNFLYDRMDDPSLIRSFDA